MKIRDYQLMEIIGSNINRELRRVSDVTNTDEILDVIECVNRELFNLYAISKNVKPTEADKLRALATVQADKIKWDLHDYVEFIREVI